MKITDISGLAEFLSAELSGVLTVPIDEKGTLHSAALLYAHELDPLKFIFITSSSTEKCKLLITNSQIKASMVIGTKKGTKFSLQMRGKASQKEYEDASKELEIYEYKFGRRVDNKSEVDQVVLIFKPDWARCTDYVSENFQDGFERIQIEVT